MNRPCLFAAPPPEVQKLIDERTGMAAVGDMNAYLKFKAARAMGDAAQQSGGETGSGVGAGTPCDTARAGVRSAGITAAATPESRRRGRAAIHRDSSPAGLVGWKPRHPLRGCRG